MTTKTEILKAIRQNCIDCSGGSVAEVRDCVIPKCPMYPFRMGTDPTPARSGNIKNLAAGGAVFTGNVAG